jgi:hypothetical protein
MKRLPFACAIFILSCCLGGPAFARRQSLAEVARKEAERRRVLDQQGIEAKVITFDSARVGSTAESGLPVPPAARASTGQSRARGGRLSIQSLRSNLQKLDREIQYGKERLALLRARMDAERWQLPKAGRISRGGSSTSARERLASQIKELEVKLKHWERERYETYESGLKAGFLPGELDGKGITP